jgi:eukaryotic-like serine/threonine-protein kinase
MVASQARELPRQIGPYTVESRLPKGGMADVYRAYDPKSRVVVLKVATGSTDDALRSEAETLRLLRHPNIVRILPIPNADKRRSVYVGSEVIDGHAATYIALEYLDGGSLERLVMARARRGATFTPREILQIVRGIAKALDYAHAHGVLHLDVKPSNILRSRDWRRIVLSDFGVGRRTQDDRPRSSFGTPLYLAPEQARGLDVDFRADLYSLGVVLYQLYTGRVAHDGTWDEVFRKLREGVPIVSPTKARRDLPLGVHHVLVRALDCDRELRYQSGVALVAALRKTTPRQPGRLQALCLAGVLLAGVLAMATAILVGATPRGTERGEANRLLTISRLFAPATITPIQTPAAALMASQVPTQASLRTAVDTPTLVVVDPGRSRSPRGAATAITSGEPLPTATLAGLSVDATAETTTAGPIATPIATSSPGS